MENGKKTFGEDAVENEAKGIVSIKDNLIENLYVLPKERDMVLNY